MLLNDFLLTAARGACFRCVGGAMAAGSSEHGITRTASREELAGALRRAAVWNLCPEPA